MELKKLLDIAKQEIIPHASPTNLEDLLLELDKRDRKDLFPIASLSVLAFATAASLLMIVAIAIPHEQPPDPLDHLFPIIEARL
ncbi:MAG: hypothetical protein RLZZ396_1911 [Planctomycetota bacterium]|jgi:hypothetical protein